VSIDSKIELTDASWNTIHGCDKISPGCKHCYACTFAERFHCGPCISATPEQGRR
jgi:protein gp37